MPEDTLPVYVIHWNAPEWCASACSSIRRSSVAVALTVIDNASPQRFTSSETRVLVERANLGYSGAANVALREWLAGPAEWCVIAAHDLHVEPDTFAQMLNAATPEVGVLGPQFPDGVTGLVKV
jgi:GT2 family glycosyltransferase